MAATRTFETQFRIGAAWTGQAGIAKAQSALTRLGKHAQTTAARMRQTMAATAAGVFGGQAIFAAATRAVSAIGDAHREAIAAAEAQQKVQDHLSLTLEKSAKRWGLSTEQVKKQQQAVIAMGDSMAKLGVDGETVVAMLDEVSQSVDPRSLGQYKKGLTDLLITQKGVNASQEDAAALGKDVAKVIEFKMPKALKQFKGVTEAQIEAYSKLETREERQVWVMRNIAKETGATEKAMATAEGKIIARKNMFEDLQEAWGKPWLVLRQDIGEALASIVEQVKPHMDALSEELGPRLKAIGEEFKAWAKSEEVVKWFDRLGVAVKFVTDHWKELSIAFAAVAGLTAVATTLGLVAVAVTALLSPIGLVVVACAGLVAAGVAIYANWDKLVEFFKGIPAALSSAFAGLSEILSAPFVTAYNKILELWSKIKAFWGNMSAAQLPEPSTATDTSGGMQTEFQKFEQGQKVPTTEYSQGGKAGPDEMTDPNTEKGYSSTGKNLTPGVVAVNEKAHKLGTIFQDKKTGRHYLAADRHGNVNPNVVDVYKTPGTYGKSANPNLVPVGKIPRGAIPTSAAGMQRYLEGLDAGQKGSSLRDTTRSLRPAAAGPPVNVSTGNNTVTINGVAPGREATMANKVRMALRDPISEGLAQLKRMRAQEQRLGYV